MKVIGQQEDSVLSANSNQRTFVSYLPRIDWARCPGASRLLATNKNFDSLRSMELHQQRAINDETACPWPNRKAHHCSPLGPDHEHMSTEPHNHRTEHTRRTGNEIVFQKTTWQASKIRRSCTYMVIQHTRYLADCTDHPTRHTAIVNHAQQKHVTTRNNRKKTANPLKYMICFLRTTGWAQ